MRAKEKRHMLVLDTAYTYEFLIDRGLTEFVTCKDVGGYFDHVWTVHAVASLFNSHASGLRYGRPVVRDLNERHTHIEGKIGRFKRLSWFPPLNFILAQLDLIWFLLKLIKENRIALIRAEDIYFNGLLGLILSSLKKLPFLTGVWGNPDEVRKNSKKLISHRFKWLWLEKMVERFVLRRSNLVMAQNHDNMEFILRQGVDKDKTVITRIGNLLDDAHFAAPNERESGFADLKALGVAGEVVLMGIFRLEPVKLPDHLVRVVALLKRRGYIVKGLLVGDGSMRETLIALSEELDVADQIVFCGNRDQKWLSRVIPLISVVVSPLTGRALAEAALGGVPIVAYDIDWHSEAVETGITGELVPYSNYSLMTDAVEKIINNEEYGQTIGENVRERMLKIMDPKANDRIMKNMYEELLKTKSV